EALLDEWRQTLPSRSAGGTMIDYPWELVEHNAAMLVRDGNSFRHTRRRQTPGADVKLIGPADRLMLEEGSVIEPCVVIDVRHGPVLIERGATVQSFSRIEGPCCIGPDSRILGGKLTRSTIGHCCRIGGEVEDSIVHGYSNKCHDGFLGHSYVGEWVNLAAGTQISDLRNDYGRVKVSLHGERIDTGCIKVGAFIGDHTKTGLGALLNTRSVIGAFCNLLPSGDYLPNNI